MEFLAVDVGKGTQDLVFPLDGEVEENWPKLILPSPTEVLSKRIRNLRRDITVCGCIMGGGPVKKALIEHIKRGYRVRITEKAAKTIRDNLSEVEKFGLEIVNVVQNCDIFLSDLDFNVYEKFLSFIEKPLNRIGIACQDHGYKERQSDRVTRFNYFKTILEKERNPKKLFIKKRTGFFSRFDSIIEQLEERGIEGFVMDSKIAAISGMVDYAEREGIKEFVVLDIGNGHTLGASVKNGEVQGIFEHHTKMLNSGKIRKITEKLINGTLTFEEIFNDGGHGALVFSSVNPEKIYVVGPNRSLAKSFGEFAYPLGDAMLYGCAGLISAAEFAFS